MFIIIYDKYAGVVYPDGVIQQEVAKDISTYANCKTLHTEVDYIVTVGSEIMIDAYRVAIVKGDISHEDVQVRYEDTLYQFDKNARMKWPAGMGDLHSNLLRTIIRGAARNEK